MDGSFKMPIIVQTSSCRYISSIYLLQKKKLPNRVYEASNFFLHHVIVITLLLRSSAIKVAADHRIRRAIVFLWQTIL